MSAIAELRYGYRAGIPDEAKAAWGARLIYPDDVVWDRTDCVGLDEDRQALLRWLNDVVKAQAWERARELDREGVLTPRSDEPFVLYDDPFGKVLANPQSSGGYLYAVAFLKPAAAKTYRGYATDHRVTVQAGDDPERPLWHYVRHSPTGFMWGYGGSGPADLARCILLDHFGGRAPDNDLPVSYQDFKFAVVARWPMDEGWTLTTAEIEAWRESRGD